MKRSLLSQHAYWCQSDCAGEPAIQERDESVSLPTDGTRLTAARRPLRSRRGSRAGADLPGLNHGDLAPRPRSAARFRHCLCRSPHRRVREWQRVRCRAHVHLERTECGTRLWVRHSRERDHLQGPSLRVPRVVRVRRVPEKARPTLHGSQHGRGGCCDQKHYSPFRSFRLLAVWRRVLCDLRYLFRCAGFDNG